MQVYLVIYLKTELNASRVFNLRIPIIYMVHTMKYRKLAWNGTTSTAQICSFQNLGQQGFLKISTSKQRER